VPTPPANTCGDVSSDSQNCGFCGHTCRGAVCDGGHCAPAQVASAPNLASFVTDGANLFFIDDHGAYACSVGDASSCRPLVSPSSLVLRGWSTDHDAWQILALSGGGRTLASSLDSLSPAGIAMFGDRVLVTDKSTRAVLVCPTNAPCDDVSLGIVDTDSSDDPGRAVAVGPASIAWVQGSAIRGASLPALGQTVRPSVERDEDDTEATARLSAHDLSDVFWLSTKGLYHADDLTQTPSRWFSIVATDFAVDPDALHVAGRSGLFRVVRADQQPSLLAAGQFVHVASDPAGIVATSLSPNGGGTSVVEIRPGVLPLELAKVPGDIADIALAGDYVYFSTTTAGQGTVFRVAR
jgi:hypothetical protein